MTEIIKKVNINKTVKNIIDKINSSHDYDLSLKKFNENLRSKNPDPFLIQAAKQVGVNVVYLD